MTGENSKMSFRRCLDLNYSTSWVEIFAKDSKSKGGKKFRLDGSLHRKVLTKNSFVTSRYLIKRECIVQFLTCCILQKSLNEKHLNSYHLQLATQIPGCLSRYSTIRLQILMIHVHYSM